MFYQPKEYHNWDNFDQPVGTGDKSRKFLRSKKIYLNESKIISCMCIFLYRQRGNLTFRCREGRTTVFLITLQTKKTDQLKFLPKKKN